MQISSLVLAPLLTLVTADGLALQTGHQGRNDPQADLPGTSRLADDRRDRGPGCFEQREERSMSAGRTVYPEPDGTSKSLDECAAEFEAVLIRRTLDQCGGNKSRNARLLGLRANPLHYKMVRHGLAGNRRKLDD